MNLGDERYLPAVRVDFFAHLRFSTEILRGLHELFLKYDNPRIRFLREVKRVGREARARRAAKN